MLKISIIVFVIVVLEIILSWTAGREFSVIGLVVLALFLSWGWNACRRLAL
jgi:hypothetical protein